MCTDDGLLLERDRELGQIRRRLQRALESQGSVLIVEGPAGIGKTAMLTAARDAAKGDGFRVLRARGAQLEREYAFGVVRQLVEPLLTETPEAERALLMDGPPRLAARLLGLPGAHDAIIADFPVAPDPGFAVLHGLYWLFANLAAERPVALVVDDVHWADHASLRFLAFLLPRLEELRVVVLLAARPAEVGAGRELMAAMTMDQLTEVITLRPLTTGGIARLVAAGLGSKPEPAFATACQAATGGSPFLVRRLIAALREEGVGPVAASAARVHSVATATVGPWALIQLERLGPDAARLARAVSILERGDLAEAADLAGLTPAEAAASAELLVRAGVLEAAPLAFTHPILRAAVYGEIAAVDRAEAHEHAARLLTQRHDSAARVAEHLLAAAPVGAGWVVEQLRAAARAATARGAPESAAAYLRRALAEPPSPEVAAGVLLDLGLAVYGAGQPGWEPHFEAALAAAGDDAARTASGLLFTTALGFHQRLAEAVEVCDRVAADLDDRDTEGHWLLESMAVACGMQDVATAPLVADRADALVVLAREQSVPRQVLAVAAYRAALANDTAERAAELAGQAVAAGPRPLPDPGDGPWFPIAVRALYWAERYDEAQALIEAAVAEARAVGNGLLLPWMLTEHAWLEFRRGDLTVAEADARALLEGTDLTVLPESTVLATAALVAALVEQGELGEAERALEPVAADLHRTVHEAAVLRHARGRLRLAQRRPGEALGDFLAAGEIALRTRAPSPCFLSWRSDAALAQLRLGEPEMARRLSVEELELARAFGAPRALGVALRAAGLVSGPRGEQHLREAVEVLAGPDTRLEQAGARADLGALLRRSNRRVDAREMLRQAVDAAYRAHARPLATLAEIELRATGARPRRVLLTGLQALTASERRIAELAAEGLTNRQIAQNLLITARTVEGHLTNVFTKLDVKTRAELPEALQTTTMHARA